MCGCIHAEVAAAPPLLHPPCVRSFAAAWSPAQLPGTTSGKHHRLSGYTLKLQPQAAVSGQKKDKQAIRRAGKALFKRLVYFPVV